MKEQQFTAKDGNNADVTSTARWTVEPTAATPPVTIANINAGYATPTKPGVASVTAAVLDGAGNVTASGQANLAVKCANYTAYSYNQNAYPQYYDSTNPPQTIVQLGCSLSDMAMILSTAMGQGINPPTLNTWMVMNGYYGDYSYDNKTKKYIWHPGWVHWDAIAKYPGSTISFLRSNNLQTTLDAIDSYVSNCDSVIVNINGGKHWVLITGKDGNNHTAIDPLGGVNQTLSPTTAIYGYAAYTLN